MSDLRIVLKESVKNDDISRLAWQQNWELDDISPRTEKTPLTKIWTTPDEQTGIHYIEDFYINARYILIRGKNQEEIAEKIRASLATYSIYELQEKLEKVTEKKECIGVILRLSAASTQDYEPKIFHDLKTMMYDSDADVRKAAIFSTTYLGWQEFREPLEELKNNDPDASVQKFAAVNLASLAKNYWHKQTKTD
ncbi:hypothetical protein NIES4071_42500 [Calothrix sp. NIES-4071]|nr:hypothetical protein NIES4071_42500 [Calothrix sp. NIES-4071]BAZ58563.1 hypothetical protein NIES4105_42420 [Calothrix sp. NIES-4105]